MSNTLITAYTQSHYKRKLTFILYYILFVLIPFSQSIPLFTVAGREVNIGMHTLVITVIIATTLLAYPVRLRLLKEPATLTLLLLSVWSFLTIVASLRFAPASALANSFITWLRWVQFVPILCFIVYGKGDETDFQKLVQILMCIGFIVAVWGIYQITFPTEFASTYFRGAVTFTKPLFRENELYQIIDPETGYYIGSANYNIAGTFSAMAALISIPFIFLDKHKKSKSIQIVAITLLFLGIVATQSRSSLFCFFMGLFTIVFKPSLKRVLGILVSILFFIIVFVTYLSSTSFGSMILETITYLPKAIPMLLEAEDYSESMGFSINVFGAAKRVLTILEAFKTFIESPFLGCGFFGFSYHSPQFGTAESFYAQMLAETGIVGFFLLLAFLVTVWRYTNTKFKADSFAYKYQIGFRGAFIAAIVANLTGTLFYDQRIWGLILVLAAIQIRLSREESQKQKLVSGIC